MIPNMLYLVFIVVLVFEGIRGNIIQGHAIPIKHVREALPSSLLFLLRRRPTHELGLTKTAPVPVPTIPSKPAIPSAPVPLSFLHSPESPVIFPNHAFYPRPFNPVGRDGQLSYDNPSNGNRQLLNFLHIYPRLRPVVGALPETSINTGKIPTTPEKTEKKDIEESKNSIQLNPKDSHFEPVNNIEASPIPVKPKNTELVPHQDTKVDNVLPTGTLQGSENSDSSISSADNNDPYPTPVKSQTKPEPNETNDAKIANSEIEAERNIEDKAAKPQNPLKDLILNGNASIKKAKPASVTGESEKAENNVKGADTENGNALNKDKQSKEEKSEKAEDNLKQDETEKESTNDESADNSSTEETRSASDNDESDESEVQSSQEKSQSESTKDEPEAKPSGNTKSEPSDASSSEEAQPSENTENKSSENEENSFAETEEHESRRSVKRNPRINQLLTKDANRV